jgi:DNA-binding transcriptional ArsR family regulator
MPSPKKAFFCPPKGPIEKRELFDKKCAEAMAELFGLLANDTRLRILHAIVRQGEVCAGDIAETIGMKPQAVSNQLQKLVSRRVLGSEKRATQVFYSVIDPCVTELLDRGHCLSEDSRVRRG